MKSIKLANLVKHDDNVWSRHSADDLDGFRISPFYDSIQGDQNSMVDSAQSDSRVKTFADLLQLSPLRANLFRAFEWSANSRVLEIGCGAGLISRYFCDQSMVVDAIEPDRSLAQLAAIRVQSNEKARVISESFADLDFESERYDAIVVCGSDVFLDYLTKHPQQSFTEAIVQILAYCKSLLSENGQLFLAVNNGYGANYLISPVDHSEQTAWSYFNAGNMQGINQSLNHSEWHKLLVNHFAHINEYYLFPDLYFTRVLLGQGYVEENPNAHQHLDSMTSKTFFESSATAINESLFYQVASKNGYLSEVANGYLFVLSDHTQTRLLDFAQLPDFTRRADYSSIVVKKSEDEHVVRLPVHDRRNTHTTEIEQTLGSEPYFEGIQLSVLWRNSFLSDPLGVKFEQYLLDYFDYLKKLDAGIIPGMNIDAISNNIIVDNVGDYHLIDHEWQISTTKIKSDYVFYRAVVHFALRNVSVFKEFKWVNGLATLGDYLVYCFKIIGLNLKVGELEPFRLMDCLFMSQVLRESNGYALSDAFGVGVELCSAVTRVSWRYSNEHYHSDQRCVVNAGVNNACQTLTFNLSGLKQNINCFRFFPFEQLQASGAGYFSVESIKATLINQKNTGEIDLLSLTDSDQVNQANIHNDVFYGKKESHHVFMFNSNDTFLEFKLPEYEPDTQDVVQIHVDFRLVPSYDYEVARYQYALAHREVEAITQIKDEQMKSLQDEMDEISEEYEAVKNARVWRLLVAYRDSFKIGGYPKKSLIGKIAHMIRLFRHPQSEDEK